MGMEYGVRGTGFGVSGMGERVPELVEGPAIVIVSQSRKRRSFENHVVIFRVRLKLVPGIRKNEVNGRYFFSGI